MELKPQAAGPSHAVEPPPPESHLVILPPTHSGRVRRLLKAFQDLIPSALPRQLEYKHAILMAPPPPAPPPLPPIEAAIDDPLPSSSDEELPADSDNLVPTTIYETLPNMFEVFHH